MCFYNDGFGYRGKPVRILTPSCISALLTEYDRRSLEIEIKAIKRGTTTQELNIQKLRTALFKRIPKFLTLQQAFMPRLREHISPSQTHHLNNPSSSEPEKIKLLLPSYLRDRDTRLTVCVADVMEAETRLREAETHDALEEV